MNPNHPSLFIKANSKHNRKGALNPNHLIQKSSLKPSSSPLYLKRVPRRPESSLRPATISIPYTPSPTNASSFLLQSNKKKQQQNRTPDPHRLLQLTKEPLKLGGGAAPPRHDCLLSSRPGPQRRRDRVVAPLPTCAQNPLLLSSPRDVAPCQSLLTKVSTPPPALSNRVEASPTVQCFKGRLPSVSPVRKKSLPLLAVSS